ncbi:hypothetical protein ZOD2009_21312 [Haladaptatus paucihalophilus DX253]|uniref:Uncharacterized protein n=1 Tax=Haladaptatus paucihalophilus DX253 TaxID=797209 RepID=E7QZQ3_HALPU|nr:hypothetical protein ZOD2009_21312 [Haladaptatus paucihalophilus DX253]
MYRTELRVGRPFEQLTTISSALDDVSLEFNGDFPTIH